MVELSSTKGIRFVRCCSSVNVGRVFVLVSIAVISLMTRNNLGKERTGSAATASQGALKELKTSRKKQAHGNTALLSCTYSASRLALFRLFFYFMCMGTFFMHVCLRTTHMSGAHRGQKNVSDSLEL